VRIALLLACGLTACASAPSARFHDSVFTRGDVAFRAVPPRGWQPVSSGGDLAWMAPAAPDRNAMISANASCHGHGDPPLAVLVNDLLIGTTHREVLLDETVPLDGRAARHQVVRVRLDGVPLVYDLYVLKKDGCVYDLSLVTAPAAYERVADRFVEFVAGFHGMGAARS
jgi:hypothetical protein